MDQDGSSCLQQPTLEGDTGERLPQVSENNSRACDRCRELTSYDTLMKLKSGEKFYHGPLKTLIENSGDLLGDYEKSTELCLPEFRDDLVIFKTRPTSKCLLCWEMVHGVLCGNDGKALLAYDVLNTTIELEMIYLEMENQSEASGVLSFGNLRLYLMHGDKNSDFETLCLVGNRSKCSCVSDDPRIS